MNYRSLWKILCMGAILAVAGCGRDDDSSNDRSSGKPSSSAPAPSAESPATTPGTSAPNDQSPGMQSPDAQPGNMASPDANSPDAPDSKAMPGQPDTKSNQSETPSAAPGDANGVPDSAAEAPEDRAMFVKECQKKLDQANEALQKLEKKIDSSVAALKQKYETDYKPDLIKKRDEAQAMLKKVQAATEDEWKSMKKGMVTALNDLKSLCDKAVKELE